MLQLLALMGYQINRVWGKENFQLEFTSIFSISIFKIPRFNNMAGALITFVLIILFICVEWIGREQNYALEKIAPTFMSGEQNENKPKGL